MGWIVCDVCWLQHTMVNNVIMVLKEYTNKSNKFNACSISPEVVAKQCLIRSIFLKFFDHTQTMINILITFLTQDFQGKKERCAS
jgi:hypothetical protein